MRNISFVLIAVSLIVLFIGCDRIVDPDPIPDPTPPADYELVWSDEFDQRSNTLDESKWSYDLGYGDEGWGNDEWQLYTDDTENINVENGNMVISAIWDSTTFTEPGKRDGSITSARVNTKDKFSMKYGKIQVRIKPPKGAGMWPAFWMLGNDFDVVGWPYCGEIDIMEMSPLYYNDKTTMFTLHWWDDIDSSYASYGTTKQFDVSLSDDYHIYEVEWDQQRIIGKIDDITYFVKIIEQGSMDEYFRKFFIILNVAVGGTLGGPPDETTQWPQHMYVDWIRAYQKVEEPIETFGIFTDETPVDDGLEIGVDAEIYVWENTLTTGTIPPYEGDNVISLATTGAGWFGGGISSNQPVDLSTFEGGSIKFMIKIPANVSFKIGINDLQGVENYVEFPANQTTYGLVRDGDWGRATIPVEDIKGSVDLEMLKYEFIILEQNGAQCEFALDDIYWDGGGTALSNVHFDADTYETDATNATISVLDEAAADTLVFVTVDNGTDTISINITLNGSGNGTGTLNFGPTDDETDTIEIQDGDTLTVTYIDAQGNVKTDTATIVTGEIETFGIFTDLTPVDAGIQVGENAEIYVWEGTLTDGTIPPYEGDNVISWATTGLGWFGGGIESYQPVDLSDFELGYIKFMIKIPPNVTFKIGINDTQGNENYVQFPANQTTYNLTRNGEWCQAAIPVTDIKGSVNLEILNYEFMILEQNGTQCEFALDDIYWDKTGVPFSDVSFDDIYLEK
ncbi:MAG: glycoside hydrolase family 16 protein [Candidatus Cloacimonetes bacterium]|nr:glycoside hydrolase family 16 protein [Candidatus Cloacimonadota bacterium]